MSTLSQLSKLSYARKNIRRGLSPEDYLLLIPKNTGKVTPHPSTLDNHITKPLSYRSERRVMKLGFDNLR